MNLNNKGYDLNETYFEHNLKSLKIPNIFIHGVGLDHSMWLPQKKFFQKEEIVFYDLLNHGKSKKGWTKITFNDFSLQLKKLTEYLNIAKFNLIGFSIGAVIAQHFASQYYNKINKLIIIASVYKRSQEQILKVKKRYNMALHGEDISDDSIKRWFNKTYLNNNSNIYDFFFNILKKNKNENFIPAYKVFVEAENYYIDYSKFNMLTLIMTGENDVGSTPKMSQKLKDQIYNSKLYIIPKARHMACFEKANIVNDAIAKFIF